ncbi:hypothetical protein LCGC14_0434470 [marine sediment metagenome]|uniref:Putative tail fiber protein gp53-like C-terminal domain-containing protein n=1 Tax=marine sediment metagenome TaxID=412755 RepID=A0A0F9T5B6_9ZZZZ
MASLPTDGGSEGVWATLYNAFLLVGHSANGTHNQEDWTPASYTGGESVTFPNGLILKQGTVSVGTNTTVEVTYGVAFPTGVKTAQVSYSTAATNIDQPANVSPKSGSETSILRVTNSDSVSTRSIYWWVWGY